MSNYQPNIPIGTTQLDEDYLNIQGNFAQLDTSFGVDHVPFSQGAQNGFHTSVHLISASTTATNPPNNVPVVPPATTAGVGQVFSAQINDGSTTDTQLFYLSGLGVVSQITGSTVANTNGTVTLPGGIIIKWGQVTAVLNSGSTNHGNVTFPVEFPGACFSLQTTVTTTNGAQPNNQAVVSVFIVDKTEFWWSAITSSSQVTGFFWTAIGN